MVRHIIVLMCHVCGIYVFVSSCKCYSRLVNVCHGFVPSCFCYFCHSNVFHAHACHAIVCHAIVTSCKCLSCKRDHVNERHTSASSRVPRWLLSKLVSESIENIVLMFVPKMFSQLASFSFFKRDKIFPHAFQQEVITNFFIFCSKRSLI